MKEYLFTSERLGFRNWTNSDSLAMHAVSSDPEVMKHFPSTLTLEETEAFIKRMQNHFQEHGFCYFAVDELKSGNCMGFIGICLQTYEAPFTPGVDIGWRLATKYQGKGYATEGAKACIKYAFTTLQISEIYSVAVHRNLPSINVMKKAGMSYQTQFDYPNFPEGVDLNPCVLYKISNAIKKK